MDTVAYLYAYLQREMDPQVERTGHALLLRTAQVTGFIQQHANNALSFLVENCSPYRVLKILVNTGLR